MALSTRLAVPSQDDDYHYYYTHAHHHQQQHHALSSVTKPSRLLNSVLASTTTTASKLLASVASASAVAACHGQRWRTRDHLRYMLMVAVWVAIWGVRLLMDAFPSLSMPSPNDGCFADGGSSSSTSDLVVRELQGFSRWGSDGSSSSSYPEAVGRALSHILALLNEIPATSRKYDFTLAMAERIIDENNLDGHITLLEINRSVLTTAFSRTSHRLLRNLQGSHTSDAAAATWPSRALRLLPLAGPQLASYCDGALSIFLGADAAWKTVAESREEKQRMGLAGIHRHAAVPRNECVEAEKLAKELLWIVEKMRVCGCAGEAIMRWGHESRLASLAITAHPRVQSSIVRISSILFQELAEMEWGAPREARFRILALWLPLFCYAGRGVASPVLTASKKREMEAVVEELIGGLPYNDQEVILANWLEDFASSDSDWPNLQNCYDQWCRSARKLLL